ncbi:Urea transporter [Paraburkholderia caffeinitolerans]|uniref:Urea transporter n=1 Tax=Paraburkholderia caffeinitolerans TaxID=1723730 RepID=A0A6J5GGI6_9BURK|nr:urea transporter [Paraburkholderia caffeinitolerans]CAB3797446.1 Urea transporter [Paraburkholderia caffeinitolerans]
MSTPAPAQANPDAAFASPTANAAATDAPPGFTEHVRTLLRSLGQIVLQRHAGTGVCLLAALALCDLWLACAAVIGAATANLCARRAGHPYAEIRDGLVGFNGALAGLAAITFAGENVTAAVLAVLAAAATAWIGAQLVRWLRRVGLSVYSAPCLLATWPWMALGFGNQRTTMASAIASAHLAPSWLDAAAGVLSGVAQTTFATGALPGLVLLAGLVWSSRRAAAYALGGAALATVIEYAVGVPPASFTAGLCGFNGALAALAASSLGPRAAICATMLAAALHLSAMRLGMPGMTAPFALAGWTAHSAWRLITPGGPRSRQAPAPGAVAKSPEIGADTAHGALPDETGKFATLHIGTQIEPGTRPEVR